MIGLVTWPPLYIQKGGQVTKPRGSKLWKLSTCNLVAFLKCIFKCLLQADNSMTGRAYIHGRSSDTNLAEIHEEMSELLDKQVNVQKESLKKTSGVHASSHKPTKKVCDKNERKKKNNCQVKIFVVKGRTL